MISARNVLTTGIAVGLLVNHYLWIIYFRDEYKYRVPQIMAFFVPCVWMVPFGFFVSVSLGDTVLPSATHSGGLTGRSDEHGGGKSSALKGLLSWFGSKRDQYIASSGMNCVRLQAILSGTLICCLIGRFPRASGFLWKGSINVPVMFHKST
jgi:hypothetical protein